MNKNIDTQKHWVVICYSCQTNLFFTCAILHDTALAVVFIAIRLVCVTVDPCSLFEGMFFWQEIVGDVKTVFERIS